jgi:hypothetical protein
MDPRRKSRRLEAGRLTMASLAAAVNRRRSARRQCRSGRSTKRVIRGPNAAPARGAAPADRERKFGKQLPRSRRIAQKALGKSRLFGFLHFFENDC